MEKWIKKMLCMYVCVYMHTYIHTMEYDSIIFKKQMKSCLCDYMDAP